MELPIFLYGSETQGMSDISSSTIEFLKAIEMCTWEDKEIKTRTGLVSGLPIKKMKYNQDGLDYMERMIENGIPRKMLHSRPKRKLSIGRPKKKWIDLRP